MFQSLSKIIVITLMMIAFIGQALAYAAMPCHMITGDNTHEMHKSKPHSVMADHQQMMQENSMNHNMTENQNCCDNECSCPSNACSSLLFVSVISSTTNINFSFDKISYHDSILLPVHNKSLYRPPIFA
jgi:hypothetical protein